MRDEQYFIDANGVLGERRWLGGQDVVVRYDDLPEQDVTIVCGIPCTTALRTVIDLAPELPTDELLRIVDDCLTRRLFTVREALARVAEEDIRTRPGALLLRAALPPVRERLDT